MIKCVTGRVEGFSHKKRNQPCQDAVEKYIDEKTSTVIVAVADGHGNQMHRYSEDGSRIAVSCAVDLLKKAFETESPKEYFLSNLNDFPKNIEYEWKNRVKDFHYDLVDKGEREVVLDRNSNKPLIDNLYSLNILYGSTLLAAVYGEDYTFALQIGDGDITYVDDTGKCAYLIESEEQIGSATNSLCMLNCSQYFRMRYIDHNKDFKPILLFLSSDGYSNSYRSEEDFLHLVGEYVPILHNHTEDEVSKALAGWLNETSKLGSGDDITAGIIYNAFNKLCGESDAISVESDINSPESDDMEHANIFDEYPDESE